MRVVTKEGIDARNSVRTLTTGIWCCLSHTDLYDDSCVGDLAYESSCFARYSSSTRDGLGLTSLRLLDPAARCPRKGVDREEQ